MKQGKEQEKEKREEQNTVKKKQGS